MSVKGILRQQWEAIHFPPSHPSGHGRTHHWSQRRMTSPFPRLVTYAALARAKQFLNSICELAGQIF